MMILSTFAYPTHCRNATAFSEHSFDLTSIYAPGLLPCDKPDYSCPQGQGMAKRLLRPKKMDQGNLAKMVSRRKLTSFV